MRGDITTRFSGHLCATCGGSAPGWKCPACGFASQEFSPFHFHTCKHCGKMQAKCEECGEAESKCTCKTTDA